MAYVIEILRQEHRNIEKLLRVLEQELNVFSRGERPDYEVVLAAIDYFKGYPDACHHPKEDMIFERLKERDAGAAATIGDLAAEHQEGARRLRKVAQTVEGVLNDQDLLRRNVYEVVRDFIDRERQHMAMEERFVFPAAVKALRSTDWADIALKLADRTIRSLDRILRTDLTSCAEKSQNSKKKRKDSDLARHHKQPAVQSVTYSV